MQQTSCAWVGHRGWPERFPENSIQGLRAALESGADAVEVDVQFSLDGEPVILHDTNLKRVAGNHAEAAQLTWKELSVQSVHEPLRFKRQFYPTPIPHLADLVGLMQAFPNQKVFVEIKAEVFRKIPRLIALQRMAAHLAEIKNQCILISYDLTVLRLAQRLWGWPVGWVLTKFNDSSHCAIKSHSVDMVICNIRKIPSTTHELWPGDWQWFMYDIVTESDKQRCISLGVKWLESWDVGQMLAREPHHESL